MLVGELTANRQRAPVTDVQLVGIEMEAENVDNRFHAGNTIGAEWQTKPDGSLRNNGLEFVTKPIGVGGVEAALRKFYRAFDVYTFASNERTSMHVHVDMRTKNTEEVRSVLVAYCLIEPVLMAACGEWREENIYCVPFYRANEDLDAIRRGLSTNNFAYLMRTCKYSALYTEPLHRFGTLEFRHAPLWTTFIDAHMWTKCLVSLVTKAVAIGMAQDVIEYYSQNGATATARRLLGEDGLTWVQTKTNINIDTECDRMDVERQASLLVSGRCGTKPKEWKVPDLAEYVPIPDVGHGELTAIQDAVNRLRQATGRRPGTNRFMVNPFITTTAGTVWPFADLPDATAQRDDLEEERPPARVRRNRG